MHKEGSRYDCLATKQRKQPLLIEKPPRFFPTRLILAPVDLLIGKASYSGMTFFPFLGLTWFFLVLRFWVDLSRACMSSGTTSDLSSGPKLHRYLLVTQPNNEEIDVKLDYCWRTSISIWRTCNSGRRTIWNTCISSSVIRQWIMGKPYYEPETVEEDSGVNLTLLQVQDCKRGAISRSLVSFA